MKGDHMLVNEPYKTAVHEGNLIVFVTRKPTVVTEHRKKFQEKALIKELDE